MSELAEPHGLTQPTISKHLKVLESAGLISTARDAQRRPRRLEASALAAAGSWFEPFRELWERRYEALDSVLVDMSTSQPPRPRKRAKTKSSKV